MSRIVPALLVLVTHTLLAPSALAQAGEGQPGILSLFQIIIIAAVFIGLMLFNRLRRGRKEKPVHPRAKPREIVEDGRLERQKGTPTDACHRGRSVFISYRRGDSADITGRIYDRLVRHFGKDAIFKDVDSIPLGIDFRQHLEGAVAQCNITLVVIGAGWLDAKTESGERRLDDSRDHLRIEIEAALKRDIPLIPVLVQATSVPSEEDLPIPLRSLALRNAIAIRPDPDFHGDIDRLIRGIEAHLR